MTFPDSKRFIYKQNPLELVICQVRFPTILRIDTDLPAEFQELIRKEYPIFTERNPELQIPSELAPLASMIQFGNMNRRAFDFVSEDGSWTVSLTSDFLALSTTSYLRWEVFREHFELPFKALQTIYSPAFFTRLGLRYRDVIKKSTLKLNKLDSWSKLLQPHIAGELATDLTGDKVIDKSSTIVISLDDAVGLVTMRHGLAKDQRDNEIVYVIDSDFYTENRHQYHEVFSTLDKFNQTGRRLFRWCITDHLHQAMEPTTIES